MNTTTAPVPRAPSIARTCTFWRQLRRTERACYLVGAALIVSGLVHVVVFAVDGGPLYGPVSWRKPITFGVSFGLALITITWVASYLILRPKVRAWLLGTFAADCVLEVAGIAIQAWRHVSSHFNTETPLNTVIAGNLAVSGGLLIAVLGALAVTAFRGHIQAAGPAAGHGPVMGRPTERPRSLDSVLGVMKREDVLRAFGYGHPQ